MTSRGAANAPPHPKLAPALSVRRRAVDVHRVHELPAQPRELLARTACTKREEQGQYHATIPQPRHLDTNSRMQRARRGKERVESARTSSSTTFLKS